MSIQLTNKAVEGLEAKESAYVLSDSKQVGLRVKVTPAGNKVYYYYYKIAGKLKKYRLDSSVDIGVPEARRKVEKLRGQVLNGLDPQTNRMVAKDALKDSYTLGNYLKDVYIPDIEVRLKSHKRITYIIRHNFKDWYGTDLGQINEDMMSKFINKELKRGISKNTINRAILGIKGVINHSINKDVISISKIAKVKLFKLDRRGVVRFLSQNEESALLSSLDSYKGAGNYIKPLVILLLNTGLRPNEAKQLQWSNIRGDKLTVIGNNSKSGQTRIVPLNDKVRAELERWMDSTDNSGYIFKSSKGGHIDSFYTIWRQVRDEAKLENFRMYDLRHSFASKLVMNGADLYGVKELLGHSSIEMTQIYAHLSDDYLKSIVGLL